MSFSITGIAFTAMSSNTIDRTNNELRNEQIITKATQDTTSNVGYMTTEKSNLVAFNDSVSGEIAVVSLSSATMDKLKAHFGENDFYQREDGITRLDNKAEAFVGGWFGDIAYKREFLSADQNQDGKLDSNEYLETRNEFNGHAEEIFSNGEVISSHEQIDEIYQKVSSSKVKGSVSYSINKNQKPSSIDEELNDTLNNDKNFDSKITLRESYAQSLMSDEKMIKTHIEEYRKTHPNYGYKESDAIDELLKKQEALAKLIASGGDASKLSADERGLLGSELQTYTKDITDKLSSSLSSTLDAKITIEINTKADILQTEDKKLKTLEKLKQNGGDTLQLSKDEKELVSTELEKVTNKDGSIDTDKLEKIINSNKTSMTYNEIDSSEMLGKFYEEKG